MNQLWLFSIICLALSGSHVFAANNSDTSSSSSNGFNQWYDALQTRALSNDIDAQYQLGMLFFKDNHNHGKQVRRDYIVAAKWLKMASSRGHIEAQYRLGLMYSKGQGLVRSFNKMFYWLHQAAEAGHVNAQSKLGVLYFNGSGTKVDYAESVYWYQLAANQGHSGAMSNLASMYEHGYGVTRDLKKAMILYRSADTSWAKLQFNKLKQTLDCRNKAKVKLFSVPLKCAERDILMMAIKDNGAYVNSENKDNWGDSYQLPASPFGDGQLQMLYTLDNQFAQAKYSYKRVTNPFALGDMKHLISETYGDVNYHQALDLSGWQQFHWYFSDGVEISLRQHVASKVIELNYRDPSHYVLLLKQREQHAVALDNQRYRKINDQL